MPIKQFKDQYGFVVENTPMDEMRAVTPVRLAGATFIGTTVDPNFWTQAQTGTGAGSAQANGALTVSSGTDATGTASIQSIVRARYTGGSANRFRAQIQLGDTGNANNIRRWGMFDGTDGAYFELNGTTLNIVTLKTGTPTRVASSSWNASTTVPTLTDCQSYEIYITNKTVYFVIAGVLKHTATFSTTTWADTTNLPVRIDSTNSAGTTSYTITARVATIYRLGQLETSPRYNHISTATTTILKYGAGMLHNVILNNPTNNTITIYDNTSAAGTVIAIINPGSSATPFNLDYHVPFSTGLTIVTAGTPDITVVYE